MTALCGAYAAPAINSVSAYPLTVPAGGPIKVTAYATIQDPSLIQASPNLLQVDSTGKAISILGTMHDDGKGGDLVAGDHTFTLQVTLNPSQSGAIYLRVSAAFTGALQRVQSALIPITVSTTPIPPPDPSSVATPLSKFATTPLGEASSFLYSGPNPIQTGVDASKMIAVAAGVVRGRVLNRDNAPLPGVRISILNHPEFGQTLSRADGWFDMAVNAGGVLTLDYQRMDFIPAQRSIQTSWQDYRVLPDVVLIQPDPNGTFIDPQAPYDFAIARGPLITDSDGSRQPTLFFPYGTQATMVMPDASTRPLPTFTVRISEFTIGQNGPAAMPGALPPSSKYTYAADIQVDEAVAAGAKTVSFSQPVIEYFENFLNWPVGTFLPVGFYDRDRGVWSGTPDGRVIKILDAVQGLAVLDVDGLGEPATSAELSALGITFAEARQLLFFYKPGQTLWRVTHQHFSSTDINGASPEPGGDTGPSDTGHVAAQDTGHPCNTTGSIIDCHNQVLGESVPVAGAPWRLHYSSERQQGRRTAANTLIIPLTDATLPPGLVGVGLRLSISGRTWFSCYTPAPSLTTTFTWDGLDAYGRPVVGGQKVSATTYYFYPALSGGYASSGTGSGGAGGGGPGVGAIISWGEFSATPGSAIGNNRSFSSQDICGSAPLSIKKDWDAVLNGGDARGNSIAGWSLSAHHFYDAIGQTLLLGNGTRRDLNIPELQNRISQIPYLGIDVYNTAYGDGGPLSKAFIFGNLIACRSDGLYYLANATRIRSINGGGIINTVIGDATGLPPDSGPSNTNPAGDNGPAINAKLTNVKDIAVGPGGDLFILDLQRIRRVGLDGIVRPFAGTGEIGFGGDGGPATAAKFFNPSRIAVAADGSVYVTDSGNLRIRKINPDGTIRTIAGTGKIPTTITDNVASIGQPISTPSGIAVTPAGGVVFSEAQGQAGRLVTPARIREITPEGIMTTLAGTGTAGYCGDGGPAVDACVGNDVPDVTVGPDGIIYFIDTGDGTWSIRQITADGFIWRFAGSNLAGQNNGSYNLPALQTSFEHLAKLEFAPDGTLQFVNDHGGGGPILRLSGPFQGLGLGDTIVGSEDGSEVYVFDEYGQHLRTLDPWTGATILTFGYDANRRLISINDAYGNVTGIERDASGTPMGISSPFGPFTALTVGADGLIASIADPAGDTTRFSYNSGLMTQLIDPRGNLHAFQYETDGRLKFDGDPSGGSKTLTRTGNYQNFQVMVTTAMGRVTKYAANLTSQTDESQALTDPAGFQTMSDYSASGAFTAQYPDKSNVALTRTGDPRWGMGSPYLGSLQFKLPSGITYNESSTRTVTLSDPSNPFTLTSLQGTSTVNGRVYSLNYDPGARTFRFGTPEGRLLTRTLDSNGRVSQMQYGNLLPVNYSYDTRGRLSTITQGTGIDARTIQFSYDGNGFLANVTDPLGRTIQFANDSVGRVITQTLPGPRTVQFEYDKSGNLTSLTPPGKTAHIFSYTPIDLPASYTAPATPDGGTNTTTVTYNIDRQTSAILRPDGKTIGLDFDGAGRPQTIAFPEAQYGITYSGATGQIAGITTNNGANVAFSFDGPVPVSSTWSGGISGSISQTYDADFRLATISVNGADAVAYTYDRDSLTTKAGLMTITRSPQTGQVQSTSLDSISDTYIYNSFGEVTGYSAGSLYSVTYTRDKLGRITQKTEALGGTTTTFGYNYDMAGRLWQVYKNGTLTDEYGYDLNGNRTAYNGSTVGVYDAQDKLLQYQSTTFTYTAAGELKTSTVGGQTTTYSYDALGNLRSVALPDGRLVEYVIDSANRRVGKKVNGALVKSWVYQDALRPVAEIDSAGNVTRFVYANRSNVPSYMVTPAGVRYRIITNQIGSVRLVVNSLTGAIAQAIDYDAFGRELSDTSPGLQPFGFAGGLYDPDTAVVRFGVRDYDAGLGRWTTKDPLLFASRSENVYSYSSNDPINRVDPTGKADCDSDKHEPEEPEATTDKLKDHLGSEVIINVFEWAAEHIGEALSEVSKALGAAYSHLGAVLGPTVTVVEGLETGAEGAHNVNEYIQNKIEPLNNYNSNTGEILERPAARGQ